MSNQPAPAESSAPPDFAEFMRRREQISNDYINGDAAPLAAIAAKHDPATFFPPGGQTVQGAADVSSSHQQGASMFRAGSKGHFEVMQAASGGSVAFWTGIQHAEVMMTGKNAPVRMALRTTEVFRLQDGRWTLVHRHADPLKKDD